MAVEKSKYLFFLGKRNGPPIPRPAIHSFPPKAHILSACQGFPSQWKSRKERERSREKGEKRISGVPISGAESDKGGGGRE